MTKEIIIDATGKSERADVFLTSELEGFSRSQVKRLFEEGRVNVGGKQLKPSDKADGIIEISLYDTAKTAFDIPVIYQDKDVVVVDKPAGVLTHAKGSLVNEYTVADFIEPFTSDSSKGRPGIVHRLDRGTSGVLILAKTEEARKMLQKQFAKRTVKKTYLALVAGVVEPSKQRFEWPITRNPKRPSTFKVSVQGKPAITDVEVVDHSGSVSKLSLKPLTGRTHQLRVHLDKAGHPIVGDRVYGGPTAPRLMLHATELELIIPSGEHRIFSSTPPEVFNEF